MGQLYSTAKGQKEKPGFIWDVDATPKITKEFTMSPVFEQDGENFVSIMNNITSSIIIFCCSARQWNYDETFQFRIKIKVNKKKKVNSTATFTKNRPFVSIQIRDVPTEIQFKIKLCMGYPYTRSDRSLGIRNSGATCYIAAIIQVLYNTGAFRQFIFSFNHPPEAPSALQRLFVELQLSSRAPSIDPLLRALGSASDLANIQHDSHEFLLLLLDRLESDLGRPFADGISQLMGVDVLTRIKAGEQVSENTEHMSMVPITVDGVRNLRESLMLTIADETINDYEIDGQKVQAVSKRVFTKLPPILSFQLCRFKYSPTDGRVIELRNQFECPFMLDMREFSECPEEETQQYEMYAIVAHSGTPESGHYITYMRVGAGEKWTLFDDSNAVPAEIESVTNTFIGSEPTMKYFCSLAFGAPLAYMVFYVRTDSLRYIAGDDNIPLHLAPHRSNRLFSRFVFWDEISKVDLFSLEGFTEWDSRADTFRRLAQKLRPDFDLTGMSAWAMFPGRAMFVGPIDLGAAASSYAIKGHPTIFYILPSELDAGPIFLQTANVPHKLLSICSRNKFSVPRGRIALYNGRRLPPETDDPPPAGAVVNCYRARACHLMVNGQTLSLSKDASYTDVQMRLSLQMEQPPAKIVLCVKSTPLSPQEYPRVYMLPKQPLTAHILTSDATVNSMQLFDPKNVVLVKSQSYRTIDRPIWIKKGLDAENVIKVLLKMFPNYRTNEKAKVQLTIGTDSAIDKVVPMEHAPKKPNIRLDIVKSKVPFTRSELRELIRKGTSITLETRLYDRIFWGHSALIPITQKSSLRDVYQMVMRKLEMTPKESVSGFLFVAEKPKLTAELDPNEILFPAILKFAQNLTAPKQRVCIAVNYSDSLVQHNTKLRRSNSGLLSLKPPIK